MSLTARIRDRSNDLGMLGAKLLECLPELPADYLEGTTTDQLIYTENIRIRGDTFGALAISALVNNMFIQMSLSEYELLAVIDMSLAPLGVQEGRIRLDYEHTDKAFPIKAPNAASTKTNLWFNEVWECLTIESPIVADRFRRLSGHMKGLMNDQATACIMLGFGISEIVDRPAEFAIRVLKDPVGCKALTTIIKGCGANSSRLGAIFCEAQCLQGRAVNIPDITEEVKKRVGEAGKRSCPDMFSDDALREAVRTVLREEIDLEKYRCPSIDNFWSKRWLWCVNGSHSRVLERHCSEWAISYSGQAHRRVAMEEWIRNPIKGWDGVVYVSASLKLETGKTRLLLACDTRCYVAFAHLLSGIEGCWRNIRTILDPGKMGYVGLAKSVRGLQGATYVMMDYDDFNSQHTLRSQQIVIEEAAKHVGYDPKLAATLVRSFERMMITAGGLDVGYASATLMSGHRGTTFINSILNSAYIIASAPEMWHKFSSMHTGDDVVSKFDNYGMAAELFDRLKSRGVRMNPMKQSIGTVCAEFLRMAIKDEYCIGYLCRSIAGMIAGNWTTDRSLSAEEQLTSILVSARSLINRSRMNEMALLCTVSVGRLVNVKKSVVKKLLTGEVAIGNGPVYARRPLWKGIKLMPACRKEDLYNFRGVRTEATSNYLSSHATPIEVIALRYAGVSVKNAMLEASYSKSLAAQTETGRQIKVDIYYMQDRVPNAHSTEDELLDKEVKKGLLEVYPLLVLLKNRLTRDQVKTILLNLGHKPHGDVLVQAWGRNALGVVVWGYIPYPEAAAAGRKIGGGILQVMRPMFM